MFQTDFQPIELAARRKHVLEAIGSKAVAILQGAEKESAHDIFRQSNDFYYLCGVEAPHAYLLLDGRANSCSLFLPHQSAQKYGHYKANNAQLADGDLVLVDAAPDYHYNALVDWAANPPRPIASRTRSWVCQMG